MDVETLRVIGVEALARWNPPGGPVPPDVFIPLAEALGLIIEIGDWVLRRACTDVPRLRAADGTPLQVSVNLSAHQLSDPGLVERIRAILADTATDPYTLTVEVTETAIQRAPDVARNALCGLRALGMHVALDDFGTGYASLSYLKDFPVDVVKIDKSFVSGLGLFSDDGEIVAAVINLARALGRTVVAEGVERVDQLHELRRLRCPHAQGFLWSPAVPVGRIHDIVADPHTELDRHLP